MIIGVDGNEANIDERVGVHQYALEILRGFNRLSKKRGCKDKFVVYLKNPPKDDLPEESGNFRYKVLRGGRLWIVTKLMPYLLRTEETDVFFSPSHYLPPYLPIPQVCTIHDLGFLKFSEQFKKYDFWQLKYWSAISIIISKYIIAVSKSTKNDIVRHFPFSSKKIRVVYHGYDKNRFRKDIPEKFVRQVVEKYKIDGEYILFLSTLKPSKNVEGLLEAYAKLPERLKKIKLVVGGKKGWLYEDIFKKVSSLSLGGRVIFTDYIHEEDKHGIIKGAKVFVVPSFWEGFGMDVVNAMACGVPVVVSRLGSLPEVAGKAAVYVDPYSPDDIRKGLEKVLTLTPKEYNNMLRKEAAQAKKFSWEKCTRQTLEVIKMAAR